MMGCSVTVALMVYNFKSDLSTKIKPAVDSPVSGVFGKSK